MANSFAPVQLLRTDWNPVIWTAFDNGTDSRTSWAMTTDIAGNLPADKEKYQVGCVLIHRAEKQIYLNIGTENIPNWVAFGPGTNSLPTPFLPGKYLTNDGTSAFWDYVDLATGVTGILDITHINIAQIEAYLLSDTTWLQNLANNSTFISALTSNSAFSTAITNIINTGTGITVGGGGTGATSFTPYAPIFGGTTPTGALQSGGVGTAGQVLTSNGAGALPTFQNAGGGGNGGFGTSNDLYIDQETLTMAGAYDKVSGSYYIPITSSNGNGTQFNIYQLNSYGSWELKNTVTPVTAISTTHTVNICGMCTDGNYVYIATQYQTNTSNQFAIDIVRISIDGTTQIATNVETYLTTLPSGKYSCFQGNNIFNSSAIGIYGTTIYLKVFNWNGGVSNFTDATVIPFTVSGTTYTPGTNYTPSGGQMQRKSTLQTSDGITFYFASDYALGSSIEKYTLSGTTLTQVSSNAYHQIGRGQAGSGDGSFIITLIDQTTFFTIPYQVVYNYAGTGSTAGGPERTLRVDSYIKP